MLHLLLLLLTWIPLVSIPWVWTAEGITGVQGLPGIGWMIAITGTGHVAASAYLYTDAELWPLVRAHRWRFVFAPVALCTLYAAVAWTGGPALGLLFTGHQIWQIHHYQRQNYGCLAIGARASNAGHVPSGVYPVFNAAVVAGVLGQLASGGRVAAALSTTLAIVDPVVGLVHAAALAAQAVAIVLAVWLAYRHPAFVSKPLTGVWLATGTLFFLPSVLVHDPMAGFWPYAMAHGLQYLAILGMFAASSRIGWVAVLAYLASGALTYMFLMLLQNTGGAWDGAAFGIVAAHFVVDAKVWRLREPFQRQLVGRRLAALMPGPA